MTMKDEKRIRELLQYLSNSVTDMETLTRSSLNIAVAKSLIAEMEIIVNTANAIQERAICYIKREHPNKY